MAHQENRTHAEHLSPGLIGAAVAAAVAVTALGIFGAVRRSRSGARSGPARRGANERGVKVERVTTINKSVSEVYRFWRNFENLPRFMRHLESVQQLGSNRSRWRAKGPAGMTIEWDAEILQDRASEWIAWRSLPGAQVENSGSVRFSPAPGARGTEVRVQLQYVPPAGALGRAVARLFGEEPEQQVHEDLHRFKQLMETGEIPLSDGPGLWRAAQPARDAEQLRTLVGVER